MKTYLSLALPSIPKKALVGAFACSLAIGSAHGAIIATFGGTTAPAATLGGFAMTPFNPDTRTLNDFETTIPSPIGGVVTTSVPVQHFKVGSGWSTWSHGYTGDVYFASLTGPFSITLNLPAGTQAFYLYAQPNAFEDHYITATANDGATETQTLNGSGGAGYFGFYVNDSSFISSITLSSSDNGIGIGEFGIAQGTVPPPEIPEPTTLPVLGSVIGSILFLRHRRRRIAA